MLERGIELRVEYVPSPLFSERGLRGEVNLPGKSLAIGARISNPRNDKRTTGALLLLLKTDY